MPTSGGHTADTEIIEAKNDLRKKVREVPLRSPDDDPVRRAEAALGVLSRHFEDWMKDEIGKIASCRDDWAKAGFAGGPVRDAFFRSVHDVKGQAATLGYPLAARAAGSLCLLLDRTTEDAPPPPGLVDSHVEAIRAIFREGAKQEDDRVGLALVSALEGVARQYVDEHGIPELEDDGRLY